MNQLRRGITFFNKILFRKYRTLSGKKPQKNQVSLEYWQGHINIGDCLAPVIFDWMLERNGLINRCRGIRHLTTVGSIIGYEKYDAVIWGSGILSEGAAGAVARLRRLIRYDVRAVRGPLTREILLGCGYDVPEIFGDPGILMPLIYHPGALEKTYDVSLILHFSSQTPLEEHPDLHRIEVRTDDYKFFIDEILRSRLVISSSLHGIILAEAYGVPAIFLAENTEERLKYNDWYQSTGRTQIKAPASLEEALQTEPMPLPQLHQMQAGLLAAFPRDIFC